MRKILLIIVAVLLLGCLIGCPFINRNISIEEKTDTILQVNDSDTLFFIVNEHQDTIDWYGHSKGVWISKKHYEQLRRIADTLEELGYRKGCLNDN